MRTPPIRVAVVSHTPVLLEGLRALVKHHAADDGPEIEVVDASTYNGALPTLDVIVYDLGNLRDGDTDLRHLVAGRAVVIGIERDHEQDLVDQARATGVAVTLNLSASSTDLVDCIVSTRAQQVSSADARRRARATAAGLSPRELEALAAVAEGLSNDEIARHLYLSVNTVKTNLRSAYRKIGVHRRAQAVIWYLDAGRAES